MSERWVFGVLSLTIVGCLIGLLALTGETVHRMAPRAAIHRTISNTTPEARPATEPEMGPTYQGNGLLLTY
jgi:hypothetical protein